MSIFYIDYISGNDVNSGSDWDNAWRTITSGATAARIAPGDIIRIAKSPTPIQLGSATWTSLSKTVILDSAPLVTITNCELAWTAVSGTCSLQTVCKQGGSAVRIITPASPVANSLMGYYTLPSGLDLSGYQKLTFWFKNFLGSAIMADNFYITLCSDTAGATPVDYFKIPSGSNTPCYWEPLNLTKEGGGNLGSPIQSIAFYTGSTVPLGNFVNQLDNFLVTTSNGLNLQSLISKNSAEQGGMEGWYPIQSIVGSTILIDNSPQNLANAGRGYWTSGTSPELAPFYYRETIKTDVGLGTTTGVTENLQDSGTVGSEIQYQGGYDRVTTLQTGETFFDGLTGLGWGLYSNGKTYSIINHISFVRYQEGIYLYSRGITFSNCFNVGNVNDGIITATQFGSIFNCFCSNNDKFGISFVSCPNNYLSDSVMNNNLTYGLGFTLNTLSPCGHNVAENIATANNANAGVSSIDTNYLINSTINDTTETSIPTGNGTYLYSQKHDRTTGNNWIFTDGGTINSLATDRVGGTGLMWKIIPSGSTRDIKNPIALPIAQIAVTSGNLVTVKAYMKKDNASTVGALIICRGGQISGVDNDAIATKANDTNWEELTITFTPTEDGVVQIEAWGYYVSASSNVYVEDMTITQA